MSLLLLFLNFTNVFTDKGALKINKFQELYFYFEIFCLGNMYEKYVNNSGIMYNNY